MSAAPWSRWVLAFLMFGIVTGNASAQSEYTLVRTIFLPSIFYVGDRVEARVTIRTRDGAVPQPLETVPEVSWGEIESVRLEARDSSWDIRIVFRAYEPGTHTVPPLALDPITVSDIDVHVRSILADNILELAPPRPQLLLPSTRLIFGLIGGGLLFVPVAWFTFVRWGRKKVQKAVDWYKRRQPYRRLVKALRIHRSATSELDGRAFYRGLLITMRRYLTDRLGRDCMSTTTAELSGYLSPVVQSSETRSRIIEVFRAGDLVKFAGSQSSPSERTRHVELLEAAAGAIEIEQKGEKADVDR